MTIRFIHHHALDLWVLAIFFHASAPVFTSGMLVVEGGRQGQGANLGIAEVASGDFCDFQLDDIRLVALAHKGVMLATKSCHGDPIGSLLVFNLCLGAAKDKRRIGISHIFEASSIGVNAVEADLVAPSVRHHSDVTHHAHIVETPFCFPTWWDAWRVDVVHERAIEAVQVQTSIFERAHNEAGSRVVWVDPDRRIVAVGCIL
mmetsp:Transcript_117718/g.327842  ORF Transcript_117718/g.327842 Transcript_117718/m.327842 type:complete len:203 (+) Transcript_117718:729-1337(+)